jgi:hypothetical protein
MKYKVYLVLFIFLNIKQLFAQIDSFYALWNNAPTPKFENLDILENENFLSIQYENKAIIIYNIDVNFEQLIEVSENGNIIFSFVTKYVIDPFYLGPAYFFHLTSSDKVNILLTAYRQGATGLSANITFGILFDFEKKKYQYISTWGKVENNFRDIDNDGDYEYICIDIFNISNDKMLVLNVFEYNDDTMFSKNLLLNNSYVDIFSLETNTIKNVDRKRTGIKTLQRPDIFDIYKYYKLPDRACNALP